MLIATSISTEDNMHMFIEEYECLQAARDHIVSEFLEASKGEIIDGIISLSVEDTPEGNQFAKDLDTLLFNCEELEYLQ